MARVTLEMIADEVGLSTFAVSRALSGKSGVSEETRKTISEVAKKLGYHRGVQEIQKVMSVVFDDSDPINGELHMQIQTGIQREASRLGYGVQIHWSHDPRKYAELANQSSGLMIVGPR